MAGESSDRLIQRGARLAARQAYRLSATNSYFFTGEGIQNIAQDTADKYDEYTNFLYANPEYAMLNASITGAVASTRQLLDQGGA